MLASELIKRLQDVVDEIGDHPIIVNSTWHWYEVESIRASDSELYVKDYTKEKIVFKLE